MPYFVFDTDKLLAVSNSLGGAMKRADKVSSPFIRIFDENRKLVIWIKRGDDERKT